jgi:hypothetical protein
MNKVVRDYLKAGMIWSDKAMSISSVVVIKSVNKFDNYVKVEYSVFIKDKRGVTPHMENITCTIHSENLMPYIRDNKLNQLGI